MCYEPPQGLLRMAALVRLYQRATGRRIREQVADNRQKPQRYGSTYIQESGLRRGSCGRYRRQADVCRGGYCPGVGLCESARCGGEALQGGREMRHPIRKDRVDKNSQDTNRQKEVIKNNTNLKSPEDGEDQTMNYRYLLLPQSERQCSRTNSIRPNLTRLYAQT